MSELLPSANSSKALIQTAGGTYSTPPDSLLDLAGGGMEGNEWTGEEGRKES